MRKRSKEDGVYLGLSIRLDFGSWKIYKLRLFTDIFGIFKTIYIQKINDYFFIIVEKKIKQGMFV